MNKPKVTAAELDHIFDEGEEDITQYLDLSKGYHPGWEDKTEVKFLLEESLQTEREESEEKEPEH